jgi:hypothetical protein
MSLTPAVFAYSLLYPYSDNYLDAPEISRESKISFSVRFGRRLAGEAVAPANDREVAIWRLVELIEGQYSRTAWPEVYASLLRIHQAQEKSIRLLRGAPRSGEVDLLELIFEKGGESVLADGYLAAGTLSEDQARFIFHWGVLLQLTDDLQDVEEDCREGDLTLFTAAAGLEPLDALTSRTLHFAQRVMPLMDGLADGGSLALRQLIKQSSWSLLIRSAGKLGKLYTQEYIDRLETCSPFRFSFLNERRKRIERSKKLFLRLFEAFLEGGDEPVFPVLPSSLMPRF